MGQNCRKNFILGEPLHKNFFHQIIKGEYYEKIDLFFGFRRPYFPSALVVLDFNRDNDGCRI